MRNLASLVISIALSGALGACSPAQNAQTGGGQSGGAQSGSTQSAGDRSVNGRSVNDRAFSGDWNEGRARDVALAVSRSWQFSDAKDFHGTPAVDLQRTVYAILPFNRAGEPGWLVLLAVIPQNQTCHACAPVTGGVIFSRKDGVWSAGYDRSHIVSLGAFGQPPKVRVQALGGAQPAVAFEMESMAQGLAATTLTLVADVQGQLKEVLSLETAESNEGAGLPEDQTYKWQASLEASSSDASSLSTEFPDLVVKFSGTKVAEGSQKARAYKVTSMYRFGGGAYHLAP